MAKKHKYFVSYFHKEEGFGNTEYLSDAPLTNMFAIQLATVRIEKQKEYDKNTVTIISYQPLKGI